MDKFVGKKQDFFINLTIEMTNLPKQVLLELKNSILEAIEMTNEEINKIPAIEAYDETFDSLIAKAKYYVSLLERIEEQLKQK